jgi:hypothetical protein
MGMFQDAILKMKTGTKHGIVGAKKDTLFWYIPICDI